ncbi:MAG TPA: LysR family transcriptional regulator [Baekduia sp.]|uniref:LysR family transcriptional regulator n=1 Tax=Baekduia sp. TaxID=2600305 RepID=UPI002D78A911|nr:LysR family transcriptional regulator [Baekduia sp.]HET6507053.1 LysR family transcriptional regulator [Baekduia sp.]
MSDERPSAGTGAAPPGVTRDAWLGVEVRHLQALAAIAREGSFREAAESLGYVQSAISQQIAQLERLVDTRLIERSRGSAAVDLTPAGRLLLEHVEEILARYARAGSELAALSAGRAGRLRVGVLPSVAGRVLPRVLLRFAEECPDVQVVPSESAADAELLDELAAGELDLAFCELPLPEGELACTELLEDPLLLLVPADHPLARRGGAATAADLAGLELVAYGRWRGQRTALDWLAARGVEPTVAFSSDHNESVQTLVAAGTGVALAPYLAVDAAHPGTALVPLEGAPARIVALAWRSGEDAELSPAANAFRVVARAVCHELAGAMLPPPR